MKQITFPMIAYEALVTLSNAIGERGIELIEPGPVEVLETCYVTFPIGAEELFATMDSLSESKIAPAMRQLAWEMNLPGMDVQLVKPPMPNAAAEGFLVSDDDLGVALSIHRTGDEITALVMFKRVPRPPYKIVYEISKVDPRDWTPEMRGLQRIIAEDLLTGRAKLVTEHEAGTDVLKVVDRGSEESGEGADTGRGSGTPDHS